MNKSKHYQVVIFFMIFLLIIVISLLFYTDVFFKFTFPKYNNETKSIFFSSFVFLISISQYNLTIIKDKYKSIIEPSSILNISIIILSTVILMYDCINNEDINKSGVTIIFIMTMISSYFITAMIMTDIYLNGEKNVVTPPK